MRYRSLAPLIVALSIIASVALWCQGCEDPCLKRGGHYESQPVGGMTCYAFGQIVTCEPNMRSVCVMPPRGEP